MFTVIVLGIRTEGYNDKFMKIIKAVFMNTLYQNYRGTLYKSQKRIRNPSGHFGQGIQSRSGSRKQSVLKCGQVRKSVDLHKNKVIKSKRKSF
jgi:hypothetical protein